MTEKAGATNNDGSNDLPLDILRKFLVSFVLALTCCGTAFLICAISSSDYSTTEVSIALFLANIPHLTTLRHKNTREYAKKISFSVYLAECSLSVALSVFLFFALLAPWYPRLMIAAVCVGIFSALCVAIVFRLRMLGIPLTK